MLMIVMLSLAQAVAQSPPDTTLFPPRESIIRMYTDCDEDRWPWGLVETRIPKSHSEITEGVARRRALEDGWRRYFRERAGDSIQPTPAESWVYPLAVRGRLIDNFRNPRADGPHEALDIFVTREGVEVRSPVSGIVVASGDNWRGRYVRRRGLEYEGGGLSRRAGNGIIIYDPVSGDYLYFAHLQEGILVRTGDIVRAGQALGRVGHTGNAAQPGHGKHLHLAFKRAGTDCGYEGVLVPENAYRLIRAARSRLR